MLFTLSGEGYGTNNVDPFHSGNLYGAATSVGTLTDTQNTNTASFQSMSGNSSSLVRTDQSSHSFAKSALKSLCQSENIGL